MTIMSDIFNDDFDANLLLKEFRKL